MASFATNKTLSTLDLSTLIPGSGPIGTTSEQNLAVQFKNACETDGFFYLTNHGISTQLITSTFQKSKHFFTQLTTAEKRTALAIKSRGYTPMAEETLDPANQSRGDTKEGYYIGTRETEQGETKDDDAIGCNVWPSDDLSPGFKSTMQEYFAAVHSLGMRMLRILSLSLNLPANYFDNEFSNPMEALRLLHYSEETSDIKRGVMGCGAHSDYGMLTFLLTDDVPGLEIWERRNTTNDDLETKTKLLTQTLTTFYTKYAPNELINDSTKVENLVLRVLGGKASKLAGGMVVGGILWTEEELYSKLEEKYQGKIERPGKWLKVAPSPNNFIVNLGDMLERWTNDQYRSTVHRVIKGETERYSIPFFFEPNFDTVVECLPSFVTEEKPAKYLPTTSGEHLLSKYAQTHQMYKADNEGKQETADVAMERDTSWMNDTNKAGIVALKEAEIVGNDRVAVLEAALARAENAMRRNEKQLEDRKRAEENAMALLAKVEELENEMGMSTKK